MICLKDMSRKRRMKNILIISICIFCTLIFKIGWIQFVKGEELQTLAYEQQTLDRKINPKRGTIYDRNGNELAVSSTVYTITVNPGNIKGKDKEKVAKALSNIFGEDYEKIYIYADGLYAGSVFLREEGGSQGSDSGSNRNR